MPGINDIYQLRPTSDPVIMEVVIGYAGKASSVVTIDGERINGPFTDSFHLELGPNLQLQGKKLEVTTPVIKTQAGSDKSSVTITLSGGMKEVTFPNPGDSPENPVVHRATIYLIL